MELFVINRHDEAKEQVTEAQEKSKLDQVLRRIDRKKKQRIRQREREREKLNAIDEQKKLEKADKTKRKKATEFNHKQDTSKRKRRGTSGAHTSNNKSEKHSQDFTVLGSHAVSKKSKAQRVLPDWLANPTIISSNLQDLKVKVSSVKQLDKTIHKQLKSTGIKHFFPVQTELIPWILSSYNHREVMFPRDVCVSAPTGSGKTLAFVLPIIQALKQQVVKKIRALIILPTQDLAEQVFKSFKMFTQDTRLETGLISGKHLFELEQKQLVHVSESFGFISKIDILVCTAGRLVQHIKSTSGFNLQCLEFLVIDEADRVLDSVQDDWLYHLERHISSENYTVQNRRILNLDMLQKQRSPQKLLFSATLTQDPEKIEKLSLFQPKLFSSETEHTPGKKYTTPEELTEKYVVCSKTLKPLVLYTFIKREKLKRILIFTHSVESTHRLKILLQAMFKSKLKVEEVSSHLKGKSRDLLIEKYSKGEVDVLVCTDFLARGIDLPKVDCVISYSVPKYLKTYIHRAGRTARAGERGSAVTIVQDEQVSGFKSLVSQMKKEIEEIEIDETDLESKFAKYKKALGRLKERVTEEEKVEMNNIISKNKAVKKKKLQ